ncbi:MAG: glutamate mutase L [Myxococcota bacterium]
MKGKDRVISIDIGSTWTKGAVFDFSKSRAAVVKRSSLPTTTDYLPRGVWRLIRQLLEIPSDLPREKWELPSVYFSSSAKGGLKIAVLGLVPELSLTIGRLVAWSSGAKITDAFSYKLTRNKMNKLVDKKPDIIIICGGTNGGHEKTNLHNATEIAASNYDGTVLYAGNEAITDEITRILSEKKLIVTENVMPDIGKFQGESTRIAIRSEFLTSIVKGRGLDELVKHFDTEPLPTPKAVLNLVKTIAQTQNSWKKMIVVDVGGATTDVYSHCKPIQNPEKVFLRGVEEPELKRSVEGDLGLRISSDSLLEIIAENPAGANINSDKTMAELENWVELLQEQPQLLPDNSKQEEFDRILARTCIHHSITRHGGKIRSSWTPQGQVWLQEGKDLRQIPKVVFTGGYAAANPDIDLYKTAFSNRNPGNPEKIKLIPRKPQSFADVDYIWPLLGNLAEIYPEQTAQLAVSSCRPKIED